MTSSKHGDIHIETILRILLGLILLFGVIFFIQGKFPKTSQDFRDIERELVATWDTYFNKSKVLELSSEDVAFLRSYTSFVHQYQACLRSTLSDCVCTIPPPLPQKEDYGYRIVFARDVKMGSFVYPLAANGRSPLDTLTVLAPPQALSKGYCFAGALTDQRSYASRFELFFDERQAILSPPDKEVFHKQTESTWLGLGTKDIHFYAYPSGKSLTLYKPTAEELCVVRPYPTILASYTGKPSCLVST